MPAISTAVFHIAQSPHRWGGGELVVFKSGSCVEFELFHTERLQEKDIRVTLICPAASPKVGLPLDVYIYIYIYIHTHTHTHTLNNETILHSYTDLSLSLECILWQSYHIKTNYAL